MAVHERVADGKTDLRGILPLRALDFSPIEELRKKHGHWLPLRRYLPFISNPSIVIKPERQQPTVR